MVVRQSARNATLEDLATLLKEQHARKVDVVAPATAIQSVEGLLVVKGAEAEITEAGVTQTDGVYRPTSVCDEGVAEKLQIPLAYVRRLRSERPDLYDANVNGWLHGNVTPGVDDNQAGLPDARKFLLRCFKGDDGESVGVARALLSDSYKIVDNLDVLTAALDGVRQAGAAIDIDGCDLTDRRMYVRIVAPGIKALAPALLANYRSPFRDGGVQRAGNGHWGFEAARREGMGYDAGSEPVVFGGFVLSNSETGGGAFSITPRLVIQICKNGLCITEDVLRSVHLGSKMDEGVIKWSDDTQQKNIALVTAKTRDAVATFLDTSYMEKVISRIEEKAGVEIAKPVDDVKTIGKKLTFDEATIDGVLEHFMRGSDMTAGGVMNAVTSFAQTVDDADKAYEIEQQGLRALDLAAAL